MKYLLHFEARRYGWCFGRKRKPELNAGIVEKKLSLKYGREEIEKADEKEKSERVFLKKKRRRNWDVNKVKKNGKQRKRDVRASKNEKKRTEKRKGRQKKKEKKRDVKRRKTNKRRKRVKER